MNQKPLVSIVTVSYNSEQFIRDTFESVLNQTYSNFEYILIDGGSTDDTLKIAQEYKRKFIQDLHIVTENDEGIYDAMNKGIKRSKGELICILNSDDFYELNAIELYVNSYLKNYERDNMIIVGDAKMVDKYGNYRYTRYNNQEILDAGIEFTMPLTHPAFCVHRNVYERIVGLYNTRIKVIADYDFTYKAYRNDNVTFHFLDNITVNMREGGISDKFNLSLILNRTYSRFIIRRKYQGLVINIFLCIRFFSEELLRQFLKKYFKRSRLLKTNR